MSWVLCLVLDYSWELMWCDCFRKENKKHTSLLKIENTERQKKVLWECFLKWTFTSDVIVQNNHCFLSSEFLMRVLWWWGDVLSSSLKIVYDLLAWKIFQYIRFKRLLKIVSFFFFCNVDTYMQNQVSKI